VVLLQKNALYKFTVIIIKSVEILCFNHSCYKNVCENQNFTYLIKLTYPQQSGCEPGWLQNVGRGEVQWQLY